MAIWGKKQEPQLLDRMRRMNFEAEAPEEEYSDLYTSYKESFESLQKSFEGVEKVCAQYDGITQGVLQSSDQVRHGVNVLAKGAARQAEDALECKKIAGVLTDKIVRMDQETAEMLTQVQNVKKQSDTGRSNVGDLSDTQNKLKDTLNTISAEIYDLVEKNEKIESITDVLYGIAKQTNLLSLNASIEAARAGDAGKGFAYVAYEVRKLSEQCHEASGNINDSIKEILASLSDLKKIMEETEQAFEAQKLAVGKTIASFEGINDSVRELVKAQTHLSDHVSEVNHSKEDMLAIMESISDTSEKASASADNVAEITRMQQDNERRADGIAKKLGKEIAGMKSILEEIHTDYQPPQKKKVAMVWDLDDPFWYPATKEAYRTAKILNYDIVVFAPKGRGEEGTLEMIQFLEQISKEGYDGICISPIADSRVEQLLKRMADDGTEVIFILSEMEHVRHKALIGTDSYQCGRSTGMAVAGMAGEKDFVGIIKWKDNLIETVEQRYAGATDVFREKGIPFYDLSGPGEPTDQEAEKLIDSLLSEHPEITILCATNVGWGLAFARYLKKKGSSLLLVTVDFTDDISKMMKEGYVTAAIAQRPESWGSMTLQKMQEVFSGKKIEPVIDTGTYQVTPENRSIYVSD